MVDLAVDVVVGAVVVVTDDDVVAPPAPVVVVELPGVVVVVTVAGAATNGSVSARMVATLDDGVAERFVQPRAAVQLAVAAVAGAPVKGCGTPARMVAGRKVTEVMWRPTAVTRSEPLEVSGGVSS